METYQATMEDLEGVSQLFNAYRVFYKQASDEEVAKSYIRQRLENKDSVIFVVKDNDTYVGFTQLYPTFSSVAMKRTWLLNDLYVAKEARKQGVAELLLNKAKEYAMETGAKSITLKTAQDNEPAQQLYDKHNYVRDTRFYHYELNVE
ncbi:GNAT family N-acetyltransferase [Alteribacillus iranensis]|uniref:Acetyltransferase (GNAT) family protein n=1 Tax=Alteribacillus iranensis TaxID=930128 RepID=A0A1I2D4Q6_9BACI|nr:GNAT family N-acetyltransferase [Alteribacillus iranensis]SFE75537.1 Acetyltransferase (GNAT) family protein [Alteribacillus iranensis]